MQGLYQPTYRSGHKESLQTLPSPSLIGSIVTLREISDRYIDDYHGMFSDTVRSILNKGPATLEGTSDFLHEQIEKHQQGKTLFYYIFNNADKKLIGAIEIREPEEHPGQLANWVNEAYWGGGRYQEALNLAAHAYFCLRDRQSFNAYVDCNNPRSYYALKKYGFNFVRSFIDYDGVKVWELVLRRQTLLQRDTTEPKSVQLS